MFGIGTKVLSWVGLIGGVGLVVAGAADVVGATAATIGGIAGTIAAALGAPISRPKS